MKLTTLARMWIAEKLNPAQPSIGGTSESSREPKITYQTGYEEIEVVNRGVNMLVDDCAAIPIKVERGGQKYEPVVKGIKAVQLERVLNERPNPFQDISSFRRNLIIDLILDGNIFIYFDGSHMYHLPATKMEIVSSTTTYIDHYNYRGSVTREFSPDEIIHIKDNSFASIYRGTSRLRPARHTMSVIRNMKDFQDNFFENGAVPGLVLTSPNTLSEKLKARMIASWQDKYRPGQGGRRPLILDGGIDLKSIAEVSFKDLDFQPAIKTNEEIVLKAIGVPPILLDSGNNANIRPNLRLYYLESVMPIIEKMLKAYERFFGFSLAPDLTNIPALQPELRDQADYYTTLTNGGILTPNESRVDLGREPDTDPESDKLRIPANIAGSAADPSEGGRPTEQPED